MRDRNRIKIKKIFFSKKAKIRTKIKVSGLLRVLLKTYKLFNNRDQFGPRWKISYTNCESRLVMKDTLKIKLKASEIKDISPCVCGHSPTPQPQQVAFSSQPFHYSCKFRIIPTRIFNKKPCRPTRHGKSKYPQDNIKSIG